MTLIRTPRLGRRCSCIDDVSITVEVNPLSLDKSECRWGRQQSRFSTNIWLHRVLSTLRPPSVILTAAPDRGKLVLYGIADGQLQRLQSVQNAAARLVTEPGAPTTLLTHIKQQKYFHHLKRRGYNTEFLLYPRLFR